jgi:organic radical activating enzyme
MLDRLQQLVEGDSDLARRLLELRAFARRIRTREYHLTNACNLRCRGCWFFAYDFDGATREARSPESWRLFAKEQAAQGTTAALLIGGEPALYPDRVAAFVEAMEFVTISSNGLRPLPRTGFENVAVALSLFGGGEHDDALRAIRPSGRRFTGLFDTVLDNYRDDPRAHFIFAVTPDAPEAIEPTVLRIRDNGNRVTFNYYSPYGAGERDPVAADAEARLLDEALRVAEAYPETVTVTPLYLRTIVTGRTHWASWSYDVCPSVSRSNPAHAARLANGHPVLPHFEAYAADQTTLNFCCASGQCGECRDSQAMYSWLLVSLPHFLDSKPRLVEWLELAERYWEQFVWSPYRERS